MSRAGSVSIPTFAAVAAGRRFIIATASRWRPADLPRLLTIYTTPEGCDLSSPLSDQWKSDRSEEHKSELQSLMRISYAAFCMKQKTTNTHTKDKVANIYT